LNQRDHETGFALASLSLLAACGGDETKTVTQKVTVTVPAPEPAPAAEAGEPTVDDAPKKPGEIVIHPETNPQILGPYDFKPGGYRFQFERYDPLGEVTNWADTSSLVVSLESQPDDVVDPYQLLVNDEAQKGANQVAPLLAWRRRC
jgi:hypothetical protein